MNYFPFMSLKDASFMNEFICVVNLSRERRASQETGKKMFKMENCVIRMIISLSILSACVNCRFVHKIEDWNTPMPEPVAECRRGCLMKVCSLRQ